jgi:hypothetical protein
MKKGLLVYSAPKGKLNIGDYIQSLAARQFLGDSVDYLINRERLDEFNEADVKLILNGWFTHESNHWPPSAKIKPLFVAFHISSLVKNQILSSKGILYLKQHEPIGCRDKETEKVLKENGIDAYFTGCLTLTLGESYTSENKDGNIYFVDAFVSPKRKLYSCLLFLFLFVTKYHTLNKIHKKRFKINTIASILDSTLFYFQYSKYFTDELLLQALYINHEISVNQFNSENEKFEYASDLLNKYAKAKLVITSRIHCALPCLSLETPVIYVENIDQDEWSSCRLDGLRDLFNIITSKKGILSIKFKKEDGKINSHSVITNSSDYRLLRDKLIDKCNSFINDTTQS